MLGALGCDFVFPCVLGNLQTKWLHAVSSGGKLTPSLFFLPLVPCLPAPNIICKDSSGNETHFTGKEVGFYKVVPCRNV